MVCMCVSDVQLSCMLCWWRWCLCVYQRQGHALIHFESGLCSALFRVGRVVHSPGTRKPKVNPGHRDFIAPMIALF
eukprot:3687688-Rhodomonas_salina.1